MDRIDHPRLSALASLLTGDTGYIHRSEQLTIVENQNFTLRQIAAWPDSIASVSGEISSRFRAAAQPGQWRSLSSEGETVLWVEPLKLWQIGGETPSMPPEDGFVLDLSDSRTWIRLSGWEARATLGARLPIDLRPERFGPGAVVSTVCTALELPPGGATPDTNCFCRGHSHDRWWSCLHRRRKRSTWFTTFMTLARR